MQGDPPSTASFQTHPHYHSSPTRNHELDCESRRRGGPSARARPTPSGGTSGAEAKELRSLERGQNHKVRHAWRHLFADVCPCHEGLAKTVNQTAPNHQFYRVPFRFRQVQTKGAELLQSKVSVSASTAAASTCTEGGAPQNQACSLSYLIGLFPIVCIYILPLLVIYIVAITRAHAHD